MATIAHICKSMNQFFEKEIVKFVDENGKVVSMRDTANKFVKMIPTMITYDKQHPLTEADLVKIETKFDDIQKFLEENGGTLEHRTVNGLSMEFQNSKGKHSFSINCTLHHLKADSSNNEKQVYIEFFSTK